MQVPISKVRKVGWFPGLGYALVALVATLVAGSEFVGQSHMEPLYPSPNLSQIRRLSDYEPSLRGTNGESDVYLFDSKQPGGTLLVLGGTHPNEPAGYIAAVVLIENLKVEAGRVIVIPRANASAFTATEPQEGLPSSFDITSRNGRTRSFRLGSRFTNILDGWPDPIIYRHYPSGQILSGNETRNLNRAYPGRADGTLTERVAHAIYSIVKQEKVDLAIDLHEAAPEYPVINAIVAHERAMDAAALAVVDLQVAGLNFNLEASPINFHGLIHRELGDSTDARVLLFESAGALQGRLRGATDAELVLNSVDPFYSKASELGRTKVPFPKEGIPLKVRVGRHLEAIQAVERVLHDLIPEKAASFSHIPSYQEMQDHDIGFYLQ